MKQKEQNLLRNFLELYTELYVVKDLYKEKYFKYTPEEAQILVDGIICERDKQPTISKNELRQEIKNISTEEEVKNYFYNHLMFDRSNSEEKNACLNQISTNELKYLYAILYSTPVKSKIRKVELLDAIEKYFASIDRALSMRP